VWSLKCPASYSLKAGIHTLLFYAVDSLVFVSDADMILITLVSNPTVTRTASVSRSPSESATEILPATRSAFQSIYPIYFATAASNTYNFDVKFQNSSVRTSYNNGLDIRIKIDDVTSSSVGKLNPLVLEDLTLTTFGISLTDYVILIIFNLINNNNILMKCNVCVHNFVMAGANSSTTDRRSTMRGDYERVYWYSGDYGVSVVLRNYSLVNDMSSRWLGG